MSTDWPSWANTHPRQLQSLSDLSPQLLGELQQWISLNFPSKRVQQMEGFGAVSPAWTAYTPALTATTTSPTLGTTPTQTGKYMQFGKFVTGYVVLVFGAAPTAGTGTYRVSLPSPVAKTSGPQVGVGTLLDNSASLVRHATVELATTSTMQMRIDNSGLGLVTDAVPWTWAVNDQISFEFRYEAA